MQDQADQLERNKNRRRHGRLSVEDLACSLGRIINISAGGMVLVTREKARQRVDVVIGVVPEVVHVEGKRVWMKRYGLRRRLVAYEFIDPPPNLLQLINGSQLPTNIQRVI